MTETTPDKDQYRDTVFLPKTDFPMRGGLPQKEPEILAQWAKMDLYGQMRKAAKGKEKFVLHDGPPYANGNIHMGHAVNKILKDVVVKSYGMMGYDAPYVPGWDCHGLPIEWKIEEKYRAEGKNKDDVPILEFREECRQFAQEWVDIQSKQFQRLGITGEWSNPYRTMTNRAESMIAAEIHKFALNGGLYKGLRPVMWSTVEKTALAEAEVEYHEHKSITCWVRFPVVKTDAPLLEGADIVIWTTTPWTLPSNRAIAFGEEIEYGIYRPLPQSLSLEGEGSASAQGEGGKIVVATRLAQSVKEAAKIEEWECLGTFTGADLQGAVCKHPLADAHEYYTYDVPLLSGDFVTDDAGTGFVHMAGGHGEDDFNLIRSVNAGRGKDEQIEITDNVTDDGKYRPHVGLFAGEEVYTQDGKLGAGNFSVLRELQAAGKLLAKGSVKHDYPHSWRSKAPILFRTTPQWFIAMGNSLQKELGFDFTRIRSVVGTYMTHNFKVKHAQNGQAKTFSEFLQEIEQLDSAVAKIIETNAHIKTTLEQYIQEPSLRQMALLGIEETNWIPAKGEARITAMIENRPDWCISRQRAWGVPIALFLHKDTGEVLIDEAVFDAIAKAFEEEGADAWYKDGVEKRFLGDKADQYTKVNDIVDVWFESGSTHAFVVGDTKTWPCFEGVEKIDLYLEGSDQHRGWFHSSLLESCGTNGHAPYKNVLTHGFVLDEKGYKMSKSLGNVVDPLKMMEEHGADIIRLWVMLSDYAEDIRIGKDTLKNTGDLYRRIRNTLRFLLGALDGFTVDERVDLNDPKVPELERYMLHHLSEMDGFVRDCISKYEFGKLAKRLHDFCNAELSAFYFDIRKDRLYCDRPDLFERRACRTVMAEIFSCLTAWLAPILSFTAEEAWVLRPAGVFEDATSVHLREFPDVPKEWKSTESVEKWVLINSLRKKVLEAIEPMRANKSLGSSLEADVTINVTDQDIIDLGGIDMAEISIVSNVSQERCNIGQAGDLFVPIKSVQKADGIKCERCWKVLPEVEENGDLCNRCVDAVDACKKSKAA